MLASEGVPVSSYANLMLTQHAFKSTASTEPSDVNPALPIDREGDESNKATSCHGFHKKQVQSLFHSNAVGANNFI